MRQAFIYVRRNIMNTKLTLSIDEVLKGNIKKYARKRRTEVSSLVSGYFKALLNEEEDEREITPFVKELMGIIPSDYSENDIDKMYGNHLKEKYL
jgi:hypothetical protein